MLSEEGRAKNWAIEATGLGKEYIVGGISAPDNFKDLLVHMASAPWRRWRQLRGEVSAGQRFWALNAIDLAVPAGQVLGVIGHNGAGKSTLLKVLSRITAPTTGAVLLRGRVASLLEVGTGFHPELSGRENIYLNGAVLGMRRKDIQQSFDEIVDFSGVERFIDTPVKRYSSGMHMRLAFAVAAHLRADIMLVDEVLAVGDHAFQQRCLGKMGDVARSGRTILFVSHNMNAVQSLCTRAVRIEDGAIVDDDVPRAVTARYLSCMSAGRVEAIWAEDEAPGDEAVRLLAVRLLGEPWHAGVYGSSAPPIVEMEVLVHHAEPDLCIGFDLVTANGQAVLRTHHSDVEIEHKPAVRPGINRLRCPLPKDLLNAGIYHVCPRISVHRRYWIVEDDAAVAFELLLDHGRSPLFGTRDIERPGAISPIIEWYGA